MEIEATFSELSDLVDRLSARIARRVRVDDTVAASDIRASREECRRFASRLEDRRAHPILFKCHVIASDLLVRLDSSVQRSGAVVDGKEFARIWPEEDMVVLHRRVEAIRAEIDADGRTIHVSSATADVHISSDVDDHTTPKPRASKTIIGQSPAYDTESERYAMLRDFLLDSLAFTAMSDREEQVTEAYSETFDWIYRDDTHAFKSWLKADDASGSMYWITGLPGSGKSTLMRFIGEHKQTKELLRVWSGKRPITIASFFFWESGTAVQRSQAGLLRSLLHQLLSNQPNLIPLVFEDIWAQIWTADSRTRVRLTSSWPVWQLSNAFRRFFEVNHERKIYLLVDGLDEFEGDHQVTIGLLEHAHRQPHTKVCVSSRPWGVFEEAFHNAPKLRLQDLTANDMMRFVYGKLNESQQLRQLMVADRQATADLISSIVERADGVFLWVTLAVRTVLEMYKPGDKLADVRQRLETLPRSLNELFHYLLFEANASSASSISRIFQLIRAREVVCDFTRDDDDVALTIWEMALTSDSLKDAAATTPIEKVSDDERTRLSRQTIANISESCVGLVQIHPTRAEKRLVTKLRNRPHNPFLALRKIMYLHRTVKDYLRIDDVWQGVLSHCAGFDPHLCHVRAAVLRFKMSLEKPKRERNINEWWSKIVLAMTHARFSSPASQQDVFDHLNILDDTLNWYWPPRGSVANDSWARSCFGTYEERGGKLYPDPFLSLATKFGVVGYMNIYLDTFEYAYECEKPLLSYAVEYLVHRQSSVYPLSNPRLLEVLFKNGEDPNLFRMPDVDINEEEEEDGEEESKKNGRQKEKKAPSKVKTPWVLALQAVQQAHRRRWIEPYDVNPEGTARWARILRIFLENGADPNVQVQATYKDKLESALEVITRVYEAYRAREIQLVRDLLLVKLGKNSKENNRSRK
ncbi:hypothetical protein BDN70DRAFT_921597 [Pholiota conissans]|uniref:NACHT domain-containing protein n=1 Tax=Pholiota conissans TaxID=109636 RepID=A0A9P6D019_9AGAR|nr:hypothetical protein BDN70DRAFT_921597 [Pholiota conissans]